MDRTEPKKRAGQPRPRPNLNLLEARIRANMEREDLARAAGLSAKQIGYIERGVARRSRVETLNAIARAVNADVFDLFPERARL